MFSRDISIEESKTIARTPKTQVVDFILDELDSAAGVLPVNTDYADADRGRITRGAAIALKARVLLYEEDRWEDVASACEELISDNSNGTYSLFPSYEGLFLPENEYNSEVILDLEYVPVIRTYNQFFDFAPLAVGARLNALAPTQELVDSYLTIDGKKISDAGSNYDENNPYVNRDPRLTNTIVYHLYQWEKPDNTIQVIYTKPGSDPDQDKKTG